MRIIALMPVKTEEDLLPISLPALSEFCDAIIIADQNSEDKLVMFARKTLGKIHAKIFN